MWQVATHEDSRISRPIELQIILDSTKFTPGGIFQQ
jgi:hypothetical protein